MFDPFLIKFATPQTWLGVVVVSIFSIAINALIWFGFAFVLAKGWAAA